MQRSLSSPRLSSTVNTTSVHILWVEATSDALGELPLPDLLNDFQSHEASDALEGKQAVCFTLPCRLKVGSCALQDLEAMKTPNPTYGMLVWILAPLPLPKWFIGIHLTAKRVHGRMIHIA